ncbi:hypothetical protein ACQKGL_24385 [Ensifer adhaerens]|uniref:hypothetical protein n=1 Tax=Ensifer adhaerens TaxID=106592 RepID=UPI003D04B8C7
MRILGSAQSFAAGAVTTVERKLAAILAADVAGYSRLAALDEEGTLGALDVCRKRSGDLKTARWAAEKLLAAEPAFTIERYLALPWFQKIPKWQQQMAEGLRQARLSNRRHQQDAASAKVTGSRRC